jgi:hypothetical protein
MQDAGEHFTLTDKRFFFIAGFPSSVSVLFGIALVNPAGLQAKPGPGYAQARRAVARFPE